MESKQRICAFNQSLDMFALFSQIDVDKNGSVTKTDLDRWAYNYFNGSGLNWPNIARLWRTGAMRMNDQRLEFDDFHRPYSEGRVRRDDSPPFRGERLMRNAGRGRMNINGGQYGYGD